MPSVYQALWFGGFVLGALWGFGMGVVWLSWYSKRRDTDA